MNKKLISAIAAISLAVASAVSLTSSASGTPRDPNGDGAVNMSDAVFITQHLVGSQHPSNLTPLDFDQNGIISQMDSYKLQLWCLNYNFPVPDKNPNDPVAFSITGTRSYRRHNCNSSNQSSYSSYTLTTSITPNIAVSPSNITYPNDMVRDYDTSVVRLSNGYSGFIVNNHIIATAAEGVYNKSTDTFKNFNVEIRGTGNNIIKTVSPHYIHIPTYYTYEAGYTNYNYALIYVDEDLSQYGMLKMGEALDVYVNANESIVVSGFPSEYPPGYNGIGEGLRFKAVGNLTSGNSGILHYNVDSTNSEYGGPVYVEEGVNVGNNFEEYKTVIGIHCNDHDGIRINGNILKFYYTNNHLTS